MTACETPGHGAARVLVNFWFFLLVYYGLYNLTALIWITKVFNMYSLNWWPQSLGFPPTFALIAGASLAAPVPIYLTAETHFLTAHNTAWISWTFVTMALPVAIALVVLTTNECHVGLRHRLSETQRIFATSWWTGGGDGDGRRGWLPASFVRFFWFCVALFVGLLAYVAGEGLCRGLPTHAAAQQPRDGRLRVRLGGDGAPAGRPDRLGAGHPRGRARRQLPAELGFQAVPCRRRRRQAATSP